MALEVTLSPEDRAVLSVNRYGRLYNSTRNSRMYVAAGVTTGTDLLVPAATGGHPTLWNPLGSGRVLSIRKLRLGLVSTTSAPTSLDWSVTTGAGADIGPTGAAILTATKVAVRSAYAGGGLDSKAIWSPTTNTFTAAPTVHRHIGISVFTGATTLAAAPFELGEDYEGDNLIMPGNAISLTAQAEVATLFRVMILFEEIDL